jgi:hypothetical protein
MQIVIYLAAKPPKRPGFPWRQTLKDTLVDFLWLCSLWRKPKHLLPSGSYVAKYANGRTELRIPVSSKEEADRYR